MWKDKMKQTMLGLSCIALFACASHRDGALASNLPNSFERVSFEHIESDPTAERVATLLYRQKIQNDRFRENVVPGIKAIFAPLDPESPRRFILAYTEDCAAAGCSILIYENFDGNRWREVQEVVAHDIWINLTGNSIPRDIATMTRFDNPDEDASIQSWNSNTNKYEFTE